MTIIPKYNRQSVRLKGYDYSQTGAYFVTICTKNRALLFGGVAGSEMILSEAGQIALKCWNSIPSHFPHIELDHFVVMPNHIHGILMITESQTGDHENLGITDDAGMTNVGAKNISPLRNRDAEMERPRGTSKTIGSVVRGLKIGVTKWVRANTFVRDVWQRGYWEHIVRNEQDLERIRQYILNNPMNWEEDTLYQGV